MWKAHMRFNVGFNEWKLEEVLNVARIERATLFIEIARLMSERSTCERGRVGCVITDDNRIVCSGYNGSPSGMAHCIDVGCEVNDIGCDRTLHAEAAAITFAARKGIALEDTVLYTTSAPCRNCAKLIINAGITTVYFKDLYRDNAGLMLLSQAGIPLWRQVNGDWQLWLP